MTLEVVLRPFHGCQGSTYCQQHDCWCPGSFCRQGISSHDIDLVSLIYSRSHQVLALTTVILQWTHDTLRTFHFQFTKKQTLGLTLRAWGRFKNAYELLNLRALKISTLYKNHIFQYMGKIFCMDFKGYLWNSTQNILPIHWKIQFLCNIEILRALSFKSS